MNWFTKALLAGPPKWISYFVVFFCTFLAGVDCAIGQYGWMAFNLLAAALNFAVVLLPEIPEGT